MSEHNLRAGASRKPQQDVQRSPFPPRVTRKPLMSILGARCRLRGTRRSAAIGSNGGLDCSYLFPECRARSIPLDLEAEDIACGIRGRGLECIYYMAVIIAVDGCRWTVAMRSGLSCLGQRVRTAFILCRRPDR